MNTVESYHCGAAHVLLMLPGALMTPQHMVSAGLFLEVSNRKLALDLIVPNLHADGHDYFEALRGLERDWMAPACANYQQVWLGGISRGGHLALSYLVERIGPAAGLCLLAPYTGGRITSNAIRRAGGLANWQPQTNQLSDPDVRLWQQLKQPAPRVPIYMGYGIQDRFIDGIQLLAEQLPQACLQTLAGGHDWGAWLPLWGQFLDQGHFPAAT